MKSAETATTVLRLPKPRGKEELAFLPAALEIVESPAPPLAGAIGGNASWPGCFVLQSPGPRLARSISLPQHRGKSSRPAAPRSCSPSKLWVKFVPSGPTTARASRRARYQPSSIRPSTKRESEACPRRPRHSWNWMSRGLRRRRLMTTRIRSPVSPDRWRVQTRR